MKLCAPGPSNACGSCQTLSDGVSPNTEGGQTSDGRWNPPTNFGPLIGDLLDMRNLTPSHVAAPMPLDQRLEGAAGVGPGVASESLWSPPEGLPRYPEANKSRSRVAWALTSFGHLDVDC